MTNTTIRRNDRGQNDRRKAAPSRAKLVAMMLLSGVIVVSGFFFAARQHFSSIDFGIRNSKLRQQLDDLEKEKRRLLVARETSLSPAEIRKSAKKVGLSGSVEVTTASQPEIAKAATATPAAVALKATPKVEAAPVATTAVMRTAFTRPAVTQAVVAALKKNVPEPERRRIATAE